MSGDETLKKTAYIFAGLAMMLNIRLSYSSAPYALLRFMLPENLFSVFVRRMASSLELWCLPGFVIINLMDLIRTHAYSGKDWGYNYLSIVVQWLNWLTFVILLVVYRAGGDIGHLTAYYLVIAISGFVFGLSNPLVFAVDYRYLAAYMAGENSFPMVTSLIHYFATLMFGNRRKYNSDYLIVGIDIWVAIIISFVAAVLWTAAFKDKKVEGGGAPEPPHLPDIVSPVAMVIVGMGLVYAIYPAIAPGMIVPFYLIDKIEMVLLIATAVPPVIVALLREYAQQHSPQNYGSDGFQKWSDYSAGKVYHFFDLLIVIKISLAGIFIYSLHYRDSNISRSIVNQPKMSTALSIIFYMCHEILLALGFPGIIGNKGADYVVLPAQYVGAFLMVFLAFYSEGYIIEYKNHDPAHWPTEGMTRWNAFCYWCKRASKKIIES
ncbi:Tpr-related protein family member, putative [Theileria annulata]|uniref:Tpr-related protein family member, putative n=1 Tax=Theileria annulata TaxID=5874 RepID=Q4UHU7_THEAN|nr:Tpr-related protein family member, putative [Theileria annulata]CAI73342.1 Tpr-related protein family member, putative [Theileria annulata]|eukprot:XP_954019.1 Tpr-related protein family member, putative [Theileria annulata]